MNAADLTVGTYPSTEALPLAARDLLEAADSLFGLPEWWQVVQAHGTPIRGHGVFVVVQAADQVLAVVPALRTGRRLGSLTTPYTCSYTPMLAAGLDQPARIAAMAAFGRFARSSGVIRLDALPMTWCGFAALEAGARRAGLVPLRFENFGNWHEDVSGLNWAAYLQRRPGALRETIRRRLRRAAKLADARMELLTRPDQLQAGADAFEAVYARSWKQPEPYPTFNVALMQATATLGLLRLGVWSIGTVPVAVQFWTVKAGHATVLKLAHDEAFKAHSPGTVLTALMLQHLLDTEGVTKIDFGRGDDAYKQGWATQRGQHIGLLLANPWRPAGMAALLRHRVGRLHKAVLRVTASKPDLLAPSGSAPEPG